MSRPLCIECNQKENYRNGLCRTCFTRSAGTPLENPTSEDRQCSRCERYFKHLMSEKYKWCNSCNSYERRKKKLGYGDRKPANKYCVSCNNTVNEYLRKGLCTKCYRYSSTTPNDEGIFICLKCTRSFTNLHSKNMCYRCYENDRAALSHRKVVKAKTDALYHKAKYRTDKEYTEAIRRRSKERWQRLKKKYNIEDKTRVSEALAIAKICEYFNVSKYETEKIFDDLIGAGGSVLRFDAYFPELNLLLEVQGPHHFQPVMVEQLGEETAQKNFERQVENDTRKVHYAQEKGFLLLLVKPNQVYNDRLFRRILKGLKI